MKKIFSVLMVVCMLAITLSVFIVSTTAETEVVVWEGDINQEITTSHCIGIINVEALTQAIREDLAKNGPVTKYVLTSSDSRYISGSSDYSMWGFYQDGSQYVEAWPENRSTMQEAVWTDADELSRLGQNAFLCILSDSTDTAYAGHIKLVATHADTPLETGTTPVESTRIPQPTGAAEDIVNQGVKVWSGSFNKDFTTDGSCMAVLDNEELSDAIYTDIVENGVAIAYAVVADVKYVSGDSGYAGFCFYQETPDYLEIWPDHPRPDSTSFVISDSSLFSLMSPDVQLALCCDTRGDVIHLNYLALYALHETKSTATEAELTATEPSETEPTETEPSETEPTKTDPTGVESGAITTESSVTESSQTEPSRPVEVFLGDTNDDGAVNMKDVLLMRKYLAGMDVTYNAENSDVNADGVVNMKDVLVLRKYLADMVDHLGA